MKVMLHCTDKNVNVEADIINHKRGVFLEAAVNTVKLHLRYVKHNNTYVGSMAGLEFTVKENNVPDEHQYKGYRRG